MINTISMITSSDMHYWMYLLAGIIPSQGEWTEKTKQITAGQYIPTIEDLTIAYSLSPLHDYQKVVISYERVDL